MPSPFLIPVFQWWEWFSQANPGIGFMAFVYGAVLLLVWMFSRLRPTRLHPGDCFHNHHSPISATAAVAAYHHLGMQFLPDVTRSRHELKAAR